jgi:hypothetical protein
MSSRLSHFIGPKKIQRRNFSYARAYNDGADVIIAIDDDNYPEHVSEYFGTFAEGILNPNAIMNSKILRSNQIFANPFWNRPGQRS